MMSTRKLGRLAGLVFALAVILGGVAAANVDTGAADQGDNNTAVEVSTQILDWE
jgi:hypothetical protein